MPNFSRILLTRLLVASLCVPVAAHSLFAQSSIRSVKVLGGKDAVEIEVEASDKLVPQTKVLSGPDRLVIDFPNATPGSQLRSQSVNQGEVKDLRVGLFQSKPPVTRIVVDLKTAQSFQIFPYGRTVIIKVTGSGAPNTTASANDSAPEPPHRPGLVIANYTTRAEPVRVDTAPAKPPLDVTFRDGMLTIHSNKATLSEVLFAVQQRTGAEVSISAGAELEKVVADIGPAPAPEVLARLLNGSKFNFLILNAANNPQQLDRVILTPRPERVNTPLPPVAHNDDVDDEPTPTPPPVQVQPVKAPSRAAQPAPGMPQPPLPQPEVKAPTDDNNTPDQ
jgi:AMIN domain